MREHIDNNTRVLVYEGPQQVVDHACDYGDRKRPTLSGNRRSWNGRAFDSYDQVRQCLAHPVPEELATMREMHEQIGKELSLPKDRKRRVMLSDAEGEVDCNRALRGEYDIFRRVARVRVHSPRNIVLLCQLGGHQGYKARDFFWRGAAAAALVDRLEAYGYSCEIWGWFNAGCSHNSLAHFRNTNINVCIKQAGDVLDLDVLTCTLTGWFFRVCVLDCLTTRPHWNETLGYPEKRPQELNERLNIGLDQTVVDFKEVTDESAAIAEAQRIIGLFADE